MIEYPVDTTEAEEWLTPFTFIYKGHIFQLKDDMNIELVG